ncbi:glycosyltransferase family 4 protein [Oribacterium sp. P6A1]|uniref:glycosyltransferase family 4 protein n=1 Tax=Oribacterium sp. P6A1 TaxID=1410612 RepID=UPI000569EB9C|nr:glycosyltransferase family 4 protein [Oribacterium sp. P6A1]
MKILLVNKFLHPNGGSETYTFKLGEALAAKGHEVQYFGMEHEGRCVGNRVNAYTSDMDFHNAGKFEKMTYPLKIIYSKEAGKKIRFVLEDFQPDVVHLNNFNYQLTPSIIPEINAWKKKTGHKCRIVYTAHDYQLICPNHMCNNPSTHENCEKCLGGKFINCTLGKCIHGSSARSFIGTLEAYFWNLKGTYRYIDTIICCSRFMKSKLDTNPVFAKKTVAIHNFLDEIPRIEVQKENYILYFGRYSEEKGIRTIIEAAGRMPEVRFVFAGKGPLEYMLDGIDNIHNVGFKSGEELAELIRKAKASVYPSEWYENCPFSVMESQLYGTPVIGADIGGIPELIRAGETGLLYKSGDIEALCRAIRELWQDDEKVNKMHEACSKLSFDTVDEYLEKLIKIYGSGRN